MKRLIPGFFVLIFVAACNYKQPPAGILKNDKMISVLTDIHLVDSYLGSAAYDTTTQPAANYYRVVYKKYKIDSLQFQKSLRYYSRQPEQLDTMYHQILQKLERMEQYENYQQQLAAKKRDMLELDKQNANIRLKPQPNWFFNVDTFGLFEKRNRFLPSGAVL